jgi:hypothetical protein
MPRTNTSTKSGAAATSTTFEVELLKLAATDAEITVAKAMVEDLGESMDKDPGSFDKLVGALRTIPKGDARTDLSSKVPMWYLTAAGTSVNMEHMVALTRAVSVAAAGSAPKHVGPTAEELQGDAIVRLLAAKLTVMAVEKSIWDSFDKDMVERIMGVGTEMVEGDHLTSLNKLVDRAGFLAKPMTGRKGSTGPKAQIGRSLANLPDGLTFMFKEVEGTIKGGKLVVGEESFDNPSRAACKVATDKGVSKPSYNGWDAWRTKDGVKLATVHADTVALATIEETEAEVAEAAADAGE